MIKFQVERLHSTNVQRFIINNNHRVSLYKKKKMKKAPQRREWNKVRKEIFRNQIMLQYAKKNLHFIPRPMGNYWGILIKGMTSS